MSPHADTVTPHDLPKAALRISWAVVALALLACSIGLVWHGVYLDDEVFIEAGWVGNDLVTLVFAVPVLAFGIWSTAKGSQRGRLVWLGALSFMLYNYAFYLFGAEPNRLLLAYIAVVALSLMALLMGLVGLVPAGQLEKGARRFLLGYMSVWATALFLLWSIQAAAFAATGRAPDLNGSVHAFRVTAGLDLVLVVPYVVLCVACLARASAWAVPLAAILNVKGVLYPAVLVASSLAAYRAGVDGALALVPLWAAFAVTSGVACWLLLFRRSWA